MNDNIKELVSRHERIKNLYDIGPVQRAEIEEFVEEIVRECVHLCINEMPDPRDSTEIKIARKIMDHFGVNNE